MKLVNPLFHLHGETDLDSVLEGADRCGEGVDVSDGYRYGILPSGSESPGSLPSMY